MFKSMSVVENSSSEILLLAYVYIFQIYACTLFLFISLSYVNNVGFLDSLFLYPSISLLSAGPLDCIRCLHRCKSLLVKQHWSVYVYECVLTSPAVPCMFCLSYIFYEMGVRWLYSCCFVECCFQDLLKTTQNVCIVCI